MKLIIILTIIFSSCSNSNDQIEDTVPAVEKYEDNLEHEFDSTAIVYNDRGTKLFAYGDLDSALYFFNLSIETDSSNYMPHSNKCQLFLKLEDYNSALEESKIVLIKNPDLAEAWAFTGMLYDFLSDSINAKEHYLKSIELFDVRISNPANDNSLFSNRYNRAASLFLLGLEIEAITELLELKMHTSNESENLMINDLMNFNKRDFLNDVIVGQNATNQK